MIPSTTRLLVSCLACLVIGLAQQTLQAQTLGGLPDMTFNPGDSGLPAPPTNVSGQKFYPASNAGVFLSYNYNYRRNGYPGRHNTVFSYYLDKNGKFGSLQNINSYSSQPGPVISTSDRDFYTVTNRLAEEFIYGKDSLLVASLKHNNVSQNRNTAHRFYFHKPFRGFYNTGIVKQSTNRLAFWLTHNPTDTLLPHNQTFVKLLDDSCAPMAASIEIPNFTAILSSTFQGKIYLLGNTMIDTLPGPARIVVLDGASLTILPNEFPNLNPDLLVGLVQIFKILPDGKILMAGKLNNGTFHADQAIRLNADGSNDNSFAQSTILNKTVKWAVDDQNVIHVGINYGLTFNNIDVGYVLPNGGIVRNTISIPLEYGTCHGLMFHPDYNAFLFETGDIRKQVISPSYVSDFYPDTNFGTRHRFYVSFSGATWPLVNKSSLGVQQEEFRLDVNPALNKIMASGYFTQVQRKLMPALALLDGNGVLDTSFKSVLNLQDPLRKNILLYSPSAYLTNSGKVLLHYPEVSSYYYSPEYSFIDTVLRLLPNGSQDFSYTPVRALGAVLKRKNGGFFTFHLYENGQHVEQPSASYTSTTKIVLMDQDGNETGELGAYNSNGVYPDTALPGSNFRTRNTFCEDEAGGLWISQTIGVGGNFPYRTYYIRFDLNGSTRAMQPNFTFLAAPLKIEILAGKRMRMTGAFGLADSTLYGKAVNVIETDSLCQIDYSVPPVNYYVPDAFGGRNKNYVTPILYTSDGKVISTLNSFVDRFPRYIIRQKANGKQDNSFMPLNNTIYFSLNSYGILGDRLIVGATNYNFLMHDRPMVGQSHKNGVHAFVLHGTPENTGYVQGRVTQIVSPATGCNPTVAQKSANGMLIRSTPSNRIALTDTGGYYTIPLELGSHSVTQNIENNTLQRQVCPVPPVAGHNFSLATTGAASLGNDFINQTYDCPRLDLKVLDPRFRLCSRTSIQIQYQNDGVAPQPNARIRVNLPEEIRILSASRPYLKDVDSSYVFDLGTLQPGQYGTITTVDTIACPAQPDSMARACFSARIEPLSLCSNINPSSILWDGAWLDAVARYNPANNKVRVVVYNKGSNMADSTYMRLTGPGLIYKDGKIKLAAGDSLVTFCDPAIQGSIQLQLAQPTSCPLGSNSRLNHSGRGTARAFLNFGSGLLETYTVQACPFWRFSYDPNEKLVEPSGDIEPGTELDYTIHFENYGNDTAYAVTVEDSLPAGLDVTTFKAGASSDKYEVEFGGDVNQPVVYFHFREIKLTGKKQDSIRSKGQVSFKIRSKDNVVRGSKISNRAHIYFDRNAAVTTEYVHSPIATLGVLTGNENIVHSNNRMILAPNPASGTVKIWFTNSRATVQNPVPVNITSLDGREVKRIMYTGSQTEVSGLHPGVYIVQTAGSKPQKLIIVQ